MPRAKFVLLLSVACALSACGQKDRPEQQAWSRLTHRRQVDYYLHVENEVETFLIKTGLLSSKCYLGSESVFALRRNPGEVASAGYLLGYSVRKLGGGASVLGRYYMTASFSDKDVEPSCIYLSMDLDVSMLQPTQWKQNVAAYALADATQRDLRNPLAETTHIPGADIVLGPLKGTHRDVGISMRYPLIGYGHGARGNEGYRETFATRDVPIAMALLREKVFNGGKLVRDVFPAAPWSDPSLTSQGVGALLIQGDRSVSQVKFSSSTDDKMSISIEADAEAVPLLRPEIARNSTTKIASFRSLTGPITVSYPYVNVLVVGTRVFTVEYPNEYNGREP